MKKLIGALQRHYDDFDEEGVTLVVALVCIGIALAILLPVSFAVKEAWATTAVNIAIGFVAVGMLIWLTDRLFCLVYHGVRGMMELCRMLASRWPRIVIKLRRL